MRIARIANSGREEANNYAMAAAILEAAVGRRHSRAAFEPEILSCLRNPNAPTPLRSDRYRFVLESIVETLEWHQERGNVNLEDSVDGIALATRLMQSQQCLAIKPGAELPGVLVAAVLSSNGGEFPAPMLPTGHLDSGSLS